MARKFNAATNSTPINATAARVMQKGEHFTGNYNPGQWRSDVPLPMVALPTISPDFVDKTGERHGDLTVIHYLGNGRWLCRCKCGYYVSRRTRALKMEATESCEDCNYREHLQLRRHYERTGKWLKRKTEKALESLEKALKSIQNEAMQND